MATDDTDNDGRVHDGFQYRLKFKDGSVEFVRDHDNISAVWARIGAAKLAIAMQTAKTYDDASIAFSGAKAVEGPDNELGPVRGKARFHVGEIAGLVYTTSDGTEIPNQAFEAAVALLDVQRAALVQMASQNQMAGQGAGTKTDDDNEALLG